MQTSQDTPRCITHAYNKARATMWQWKTNTWQSRQERLMGVEGQTLFPLFSPSSCLLSSEKHILHMTFFIISKWVVLSLNPSAWKHLISKLSKFLPWTEGSYQHLVKFFLLQDLLPSFLSVLVQGPPGSAVQRARAFFPLVPFTSSLWNGIGHQEPLETCLYGACAMQSMPVF